MTTSWFSESPASRSRGPLPTIVVGIAGALASLGLVLTGLVFFALAIAFPIAVPLATSMGLPVSPHDAAVASRFAGLTPVFVVVSVLAFGASLGVLALTIRSIEQRES